MDRRTFLALSATSVGSLATGAQPKEKVKIVSSLPRTGSARGQTNTIVNGIQMAIDEFGGEVAGMKIEYSDWDDATAGSGSWAAEAETANAQKAAADPDVMAFIGPYNSGAAKVSMPLLNEAGLLQISPAVTWPGLTKKVPGVEPNEPDVYRPAKKVTFCRVCTTDDVQGGESARWAKLEKDKGGLGIKRVYILDDKELYGQGIAKIFAQTCREIGVEVIDHESINVTSNEFVSLMTKIKGTNPDLLYFGGTTQSKGGQIAKDMARVGLTCPMMAPDGCYEQAFIESAGADVLNNRCYITIGGTDPSKLTGAGAEFVKKYKEKFQKDPEAYAVYGYEAAKVVLEKIKEVGKKDREAIVKAVISTKDFDKGALGQWSFDENGDISLQKLTISKVVDGKITPVTSVDFKK
jgi:branched-chain amino acid transport system substrate-binding protein